MLIKATMFDNTSITTAAKGLDAATLRGKSIADNLANVTTPGYQRVEVAFEEQLKKALDGRNVTGAVTDPNQFRSGRPSIAAVKPVAFRAEDPTKPGELNNVDVDLEASKLAENQLMYNFEIKMVRDRIATILDAAKAK